MEGTGKSGTVTQTQCRIQVIVVVATGEKIETMKPKALWIKLLPHIISGIVNSSIAVKGG